MDSTDRQRLERFHKGDQSAFTGLVKQYLPLVHAVAMRITSNPTKAEDVCQTVFAALATKPPAFFDRVPVPVWLHGRARASSLDLLRSEKRRRVREQTAADLHFMSATDPSLAWSQIAPFIDELVSQLPARDRQLILARFFEGRSHRQIGESLGVAEDAVRKRLNRCLEKLRHLLRRHGIDTTTGALGACLAEPGFLVSSASADLVFSVSNRCADLAGASLSSGIFPTLGIMTKTQAIIAVALVLGTGVFLAGRLGSSSPGGHDWFSSPVPAARTTGGGGNPAAEKGGASSSEDERFKRLRAILAHPDELYRLDALGKFVDALGLSEFPEMIDFAGKQLGGEEGMSARKLMFLAWAQKDGEGALQKLIAVKLAKDADWRSVDSTLVEDDGVLAHTFLCELAEKDPQAALPYTAMPLVSEKEMEHVKAGHLVVQERLHPTPLDESGSLKPNPFANRSTDAVFAIAARQDLAFATREAIRLKDAVQPHLSMKGIVSELAPRGEQATADWLSGIDPLAEQSRAIWTWGAASYIKSSLAGDPSGATALRLLENHPGVGPREEYLRILKWAMQKESFSTKVGDTLMPILPEN